MSSFDEILRFDVAALSQKIRAQQLSPVEVAEAYLNRIEQTDDRIRAYITVTARGSARGRQNS